MPLHVMIPEVSYVDETGLVSGKNNKFTTYNTHFNKLKLFPSLEPVYSELDACTLSSRKNSKLKKLFPPYNREMLRYCFMLYLKA